MNLMEPMDVHNEKLVANVHPPDWKNPEPAPCYNMVVLGAGTAGLVAAAGAAGLGAKVALVERHLLGGDCLNYGCVPSKAIIRSSRLAADIKRGLEFGLLIPDGVDVNFAAVMSRMRRLRSGISFHDSANRFQGLGVDVYLGNARFSGPNTVEVDGNVLRFKKAVIATGARAVKPRIEGIDEVGCLTNETVFSLTERPEHLAVIGGGPLGCEMSQAFARLGSRVTIFHNEAHLLNREDPDAAKIVQDQFFREGIRLVLKAGIKRVFRNGQAITIAFSENGKEGQISVNAILAGAGRVPNVDGMDLEKAGVEYDPMKGIVVNDYLQTSNPRIYAAGDACLPYKFTHTADASARIALRNALFFGRKKWSVVNIPWCTYTDPEVAHTGLSEEDAKKRGIDVDIFTRPFSEVDRAVLDGEAEGFVKVMVKRGTDRILGATIVARHAGEMISEISVAMAARTGLGSIADVIHPYPTQAEAIRQAGDAYNRTRLTPMIRNLLILWFRWMRYPASQLSTPHRI
jgi:pyruvate/2-oxoglutarate dehydrogenase complex dihydrolipoamide dehydrogenase (E3) component